MIARILGEGTPLIVVHGFGVDHRIVLPIEQTFSDSEDQLASWQRIYLDLPWTQDALDTGAQTPKEIADQVLAEVKEIVGTQPFAILGNSFGAMIARHVAHSLQDQCIGLATLVGAWVFEDDLRKVPTREVVKYDAKVLEKAGPGRDDFEYMAVLHTDKALEAFNTYVLPGLRGANVEVLQRLRSNYHVAYTPEKDAATMFAAPALHLFGKQDHVVGYEDGLAFTEHYPRGSFIVIDAAGHHLQLEQPDLMVAHLRAWLANVSTYASQA